MGFLNSGVPLLLVLLLGLYCATVSCSAPPPEMLHESYAGKSEFRTVNRKELESCLHPSQYLAINVSTGGAPLPDEAFLQVTVSGVLKPDPSDWVAMITPSNSSVSGCPLSGVNYVETGDLANLPLLCHYPVKAQRLTSDPGYMGCKNAGCGKRDASGACEVKTCNATLTFHVVNFRTDVEFVLFSGGFKTPCVLKRSDVLRFANPASPLYGHLSSIDSTATSMKVTWVSEDANPQQVQYGDGRSSTSQVSTFTQDDMCSIPLFPSPAKDFGWHDPGYIHSAVMTGLKPSRSYKYRYGRDYAESGSVYVTPDSGGECGVAYQSYFPMPAASKDKPWYSIEQGSVHFIVMSTEHEWSEKSEQVETWSLSRFSEFGYARVHATRTDMNVQFVNSSTMEVRDQFKIVKGSSAKKPASFIIQQYHHTRARAVAMGGLSGSGVALLVLLGLCAAVSSSMPPPESSMPPPEMLHESFAGKSEFRTVNRKLLGSCLNPSPYLSISVSTGGAPQLLPDEAFLKVTVAGVLRPDDDDWVAMITPSNSSVSGCPFGGVNYVQTGDLAHLPLLCHYPVKRHPKLRSELRLGYLTRAYVVLQAQHLTSDPGYLGCKNATCQKKRGGASGACRVRTCAATLTFHVVNFRTDVEFILFSGGFGTPCVLKRSGALRFANPARPLYGHLSSIDSRATSVSNPAVSISTALSFRSGLHGARGSAMDAWLLQMRLTWVSGDGRPQQVQYGAGKSAASQLATFTQKDMCGIPGLPSPAKDFGWHDPGYIHSAVMTGLQPSQSYTYRYGRDYAESGSVYVTPDSGGECGVAYESYFRMPVVIYQSKCRGMPKKDASGTDTYDNSNYTTPVHAIVGSGGFSLDKFPKIVVRAVTKPFVCSPKQAVHNLEVIGQFMYMHSLKILPCFPNIQWHKWSLSRVSEFGYARVHATRTDILVQVSFVFPFFFPVHFIDC
ncbi:hypothetical protein BAE44_0020663 [Dichanthelium oligosanthes]|uniref:Uncharacterized protein n=1 Tax=Dichanthelium oligosanthes TaxID=888268 RepID=A0A1E5UZK6_9POAL|nr:hypothetical protein BAE44_0020663 [Dichanthelium oligosanthes]